MAIQTILHNVWKWQEYGNGPICQTLERRGRILLPSSGAHNTSGGKGRKGESEWHDSGTRLAGKSSVPAGGKDDQIEILSKWRSQMVVAREMTNDMLMKMKFDMKVVEFNLRNTGICFK